MCKRELRMKSLASYFRSLTSYQNIASTEPDRNTTLFVKFALLFIIFLSLFVSACSQGHGDGTTVGQKPATPDKVETLPPSEAPSTSDIVTVKVTYGDGTSIQSLAQANGLIVRLNTSVSAQQEQNTFSTASVRINQRLPIVAGLSLANILPGQTLDEAIAILSADPTVEYVEPNYIVSTQAIPNDSRFVSQWGLNNTGQTGGRNDADIDAPEAWDSNTGGNTVIAVIDTGVDYNHPDLLGNIWTNPGEIAGNGRDDDGNGFIDDVRGWDFANNDNNPIDDNNHGTHVAGVIAARTNNNSGIAGINWSARIMPLKFMNAQGQGSTFGAIQAIQYAVANGARVSNNSWGGGGFSRALYDAIAAANTAGHTFVAAAGNSSSSNDTTPHYPSSFNLPNIISVAATDSSDRLATFSNYGATTVDLGAPGVSILSTIRSGNYASYSGTSMAAPFVTGAVGLLFSTDPGLTTAQVKTLLLDNVDLVSSLNSRTVSNGRLNIGTAIAQLSVSTPTTPTPVPSPSPAPVNINISPNIASLVTGQSLGLSASGGTAPYIWQVNNPTLASVSATGSTTGMLIAIAAGSVTVTASDSNGNTGVTGIINITNPAPPAPDPLVITPMSGVIGIGQTMHLTATGGVTPYSWQSSNPAIASINVSTGLLSGIATGNVTVSVTDNTGSTAITNQISVASLSIMPELGVLPVNDSYQLSALGGTPPYVWRSSNTAIILVNSAGRITTLSPGTAEVTVTDANGITASTGPVVVRRVNVTPATGNLAVGDTLQLTASGGSTPYSWTSTDPGVATIDNAGLLTALRSGSVNVFVSDADGFGAITGAILIASGSNLISITPQTATVSLNTWQLFTASGGTPPYSWRLRNPSAGFIYSSVWPGWFLANSAVGMSTTIIVVDANGNVAESGTVTIVP